MREFMLRLIAGAFKNKAPHRTSSRCIMIAPQVRCID
jgi:hypothetical protein